jgi:murein DD-endopeptidase MepM/ murein hydrolase activator NlpD
MRIKIILLIIIMNIISSVYAQNKNGIVVNFKRNDDKSVDFYYEKNIPGSVFFKMTFTSIGNASVRDYEQVLAYPSGSLTKLTPIFPEQHINFQYSYSYVMGNPRAKTDTTFQYILPFKKSKKVQVFETDELFETFFGSKIVENWKSYLVKSNNTDTVCAMRKGIVVRIVNEYTTAISNRYKHLSRSNLIVIEHADGTYATYIGLKKNTFFVKLGEVVHPNTALGIIDISSEKTFDLYFNICYLKTTDINYENSLIKGGRLHD